MEHTFSEEEYKIYKEMEDATKKMGYKEAIKEREAKISEDLKNVLESKDRK